MNEPSDFKEFRFSPSEFSGVARLFPLPNLVMFPHVVQMLHVFEPRYRQMVEHALQDDHLIAMTLLREGWQSDYDGCPPVETMACLGSILASTRDADGGYNILLLGVHRVRLTGELAGDQLYRRSEAELVGDLYESSADAERAARQRSLLDGFRRLMKDNETLHQQFTQVLSGQLPLGMLTDIVAHGLDLELPGKQELLNEPSVDKRATILKRLMDRLIEGQDGVLQGRRFPPEFSSN